MGLMNERRKDHPARVQDGNRVICYCGPWGQVARRWPSILCPTVFEEPEDPSNRSFFSEIISSVSDVKFSHSGRYMLTRDYLTVKVWDLNMEARPIETYQVGATAQTHQSPSRSPFPGPRIPPPPGGVPGRRGGFHMPVSEAKTLRLRKSGSRFPAPQLGRELKRLLGPARSLASALWSPGE